jgi:hypothetical protein
MNKLNHQIVAAGLMAGLVLQLTSLPCAGQVAPLPPGVQDIVKLSKSGLGDDVVLAQIRNGGASYNLTVDQILYLRDQGLSQNVIKALLGTGGAAPVATAPTPAEAIAAPAPMVTAPTAPPPASLDSFRAQLAPYGTWMDLPGYGPCWRPAIASADPFWRPYCDQGHWAYTADGWQWQSDVPWGDIVFHYGRWFRDPAGWAWVPGYDWAPAWVCWRHAEGVCGWAPLPPTAVFRAGVGLWFGGRLAVDVDFGLAPEMFIFAPYDRFWEPNLRAFLLPRDRALVVFRHSTILNGYRFDHGRFVVEGIGRERMAALTHHAIRVEESHRGEIRAHEAEHRAVEEKERHEERRDRRDR